MVSDELFMKRCIQLALLGKGSVAPNPMVGSVIVHNDTIIGEGYHEKFGEAHAEVNAISSVKDKSLLINSTIYVSLEPCAHFGKTPPCANLIVQNNFKRVVIGCRDPFSKVNGQGIKILQSGGIETTVGVLESECLEINKAFFTVQEKRRPYVLLKWAQSGNGYLDENFERTSISAPETQTLVHLLRNEYQSILIGFNTALRDNPSLTVRAVHGKNPIRIVVDPNNELPEDLQIFNSAAKTIIINTKRSDVKGNIEYILVETINPHTILTVLLQKDIQSVLIEGGAKTLISFINENLWDEAVIITNSKIIDSGTKAPVLSKQPYKKEDFFTDTILTYKN